MLNFLSNMQWHDVNTPFFFCGFMMCVIIVKIFFHALKLSRILPESAILILLGLIAGFILDFYFFWDIYLHPDLFFLYLLPPIALEAGYFLPFRYFFKNFFTILTYALFGTILNICFIAGCLWFFSDHYQWSIPFIDLLLFATLISAVDPVAVLSVFEEIHVNQLLYIHVFGESLLNDAVVIVLYHSLGGMARIGQENIIKEDITQAVVSFFTVSVGGIILGVVFVVITAFVTKHSHRIPVVQPLICLLFPYCCYLLCEFVHMSGIIGIVTCGLLMKPYTDGNLEEKNKTTTKSLLKTLSNACEAIVFLFLGISLFSKNHNWDVIFIVVTLASCLFGRFIVMFFLTYFANKRRVQKIALVDQVIIGFGGLRGAICYGLVQTLDIEVIHAKDMMITTTVCVIAFTVFIQGSTIKKLVELLKVKTLEERQETVTEKVLSNFADDVMAGIEAVVGKKGGNYYRRRLSEFNHNIIEPNLMVAPSSRGERLVRKVAELNSSDTRRRLLENYNV